MSWWAHCDEKTLHVSDSIYGVYVTPGGCPDSIAETRHTGAEICGPGARDWQKVTKITWNQLDANK